MAKFTRLNPREVTLGRGIAAREARIPYVEALRNGEAGQIELDRGEKPATVKRLFQEAAKEAGVRARSSWSDKKQQVLLWKRVGK